MYLSCIDHVLGATTRHLERTCLGSLTTFSTTPATLTNSQKF